MIIVNDMEQMSPEWFKARAGIPTASNFDKIITSKGKRSTQRTKYMYQLAGERIIGDKPEGYTNAAMERGIELESAARGLYAMTRLAVVEEVALCFSDERKRYSCSPDGLVDGRGGIEIKCPSIHTHVEYLYKGKLPTKYFQQVQGSLFVTGLEWWDFVSYYPGLPLFVVRVEPDFDFHKNLLVELESFCNDVDDIVSKINAE